MSPVQLLDRARTAHQVPATSVALVWRDREVTYGELCSLVDAARSDLRASGLQASDAAPGGGAIAVEARKTPATIALILALQACNHPVLVLPAGLGADARAAVRLQAGASVEIVAGDDGPALHALDGASLRARSARAPAESVDAALILTTSGSTGVPKGVCLPRAAIERFFAWAQAAFGITPGTRVLSYAPLNFDLSLLELWATLQAGATAILVEPDEAADAQALARIVAQGAPEVIQGVPLLYKLLDRAAPDIGAAARHVIVTGEHAPLELRRSMSARFRDARFHNVYGSTETNDSFVLSSDGARFATLERLPIGAPIAGTRYRIVGDGDAEIAGAEAGELHTATPFAARGYTDPALTRAAFYARDEDGEARCYYRTGDVVARDAAGDLHLAGRRDLLVKVRGVRTNLQDVEAALEAHLDIELAVVCPVADDTGETALRGVVQTRPGARVSTLELRQLCAARLPRSAIPGHLHVTDRPLPRTSTGKPDRKQIAATLLERPPT